MSMMRTKSKKSKKRTHRYTSNVFSMFNQAQIQEFKEAFNMIDQNRDGFIDKDDLIEMLTSLGKNPEDQLLDNMINEAPGAINFTMFLTLFGEKLNGTDPEDVIKNAFGCFDVKTEGVLAQDYLREIMTTMGDRWTNDMVDELFYGAPIKEGVFDYIEFTRMLKHGARDKDDEPIEPPKTPTTPAAKPNAPGKFAFQSAEANKNTAQTASSQPSPAGVKSPQAAPKPQSWKKPKAKSPPPPSKKKSPPPPGATKPKSPSTSGSKIGAGKTQPPSPGVKPDLPPGNKPEMPTLKSPFKMQSMQGKAPTPNPLKPVLKSTMKYPLPK